MDGLELKGKRTPIPCVRNDLRQRSISKGIRASDSQFREQGRQALFACMIFFS
jgi:hypothetical protein